MLIQFNSTVLCRNIRYLRTKYGMTQKTLAHLAGVQPHALRHLEAGKVFSVIQYDVLVRICAVFDVGIEEMTKVEMSIRDFFRHCTKWPLAGNIRPAGGDRRVLACQKSRILHRTGPPLCKGRCPKGGGIVGQNVVS